jgi:ATP-dependent Clp protease ATP-binding subunit ClpC
VEKPKQSLFFARKTAAAAQHDMKKIDYPLVYFQLQPESVLGILVGTGIEAVGSDLSSLKRDLQEHLQRQYKKQEDYPVIDITQARLRTTYISIQPAFRSKSGAYPFSNKLQVGFPIVYGPSSQGHYECYLPLLDESFYYFDPQQLDGLVQYIGLSLLNGYPPEKLFRLMMYPEAQLDSISLRVKPADSEPWHKFRHQPETALLQRLAEPYPLPKSQQRSMAALPEAAWEMEDKALEAADKLISARANVLIVGAPGAGKSAVLRQAIRKIHQQSRQQQWGFTFWRILPQRITASVKYLGQWEGLCEELIQELGHANGILWIENLTTLLQAGGEGPEDSMAAFFTPFLKQGKLQILGEASPAELESIRRLLPGFAELFQTVTLEELEEKKIYNILREFAQYAKQNHRVVIAEEAISLSYRLLARYHPYEAFPGKGIKFLGHCIHEAKLEGAAEISPAAIIERFAQQTGLPELFLRDDLRLDPQELQGFFAARIIGQPEAIQKMIELVKIFKAGLNNPGKPISTLLFVGPTGVGKTACAKALAAYFFGKGQRKSPLIRIDMSEFQYPGQIVRLIGTGREPGLLVREIRERPFSVLLLDEAEKADPAIFDALLGLLDEGLLLDAFGREANFRNTIIIMTSNLGATNQKSIGFKNMEDEAAKYHSAIARHFRPEFVNRIDQVVTFKSLTSEEVRSIARKELDELKRREGFVKRGLHLHFTAALAEHLSKIGFDERYGARPLQRSIEQSLVAPIANWLLAHPTAENCAIQVDYDGKLQIDIQP